MDRPQLHKLAKEMLAEATAVVESHERGGIGIDGIALTDPKGSFQWFGGDQGAEKFWCELCFLFMAAKAVRAREFDAGPALKFKMREVKRLIELL
jgi:hypothetical protein